MQGGHAVDAVGADDGQVGHVDLAVPEDGGVPELFLPVGQGAVKGGHIPPVDLLDDLIDPGQQHPHQVDGPLLQRLGHDGVVGVGDGLPGDLPGLVPAHALLVHQHPHQLRHAQGRVGVVGVDADLVGEDGPVVAVGPLESLDDVRHAGGHEEVFLLQPQGLAGLGAVVGVEDAGDGLDLVPVLHGAGVVAPVEGGQIQLFHHRLGAPQPEHVDGLAAVAHDGHLIGHRHDGLGALGEEVGLAVRTDLTLHIAAEPDGDGLVGFLRLPGIAVLQPAVRLLGLVAVDDLLTEQAEPVADAHAHAGNAQIGHGVQEAGRQTAQAAVSEAGVLFALAQRIQVDAQIVEALPDRLFDLQIDQIVPEQAADQKLHGEVVDLFLLVPDVALGGLGPHLTGGAGDQIDQQLVFFKGGTFGDGLGEGFQGLGLICHLEVFFSCKQ